MKKHESAQQGIEIISQPDKVMFNKLYQRCEEILQWLLDQVRPIYGQMVDIQKDRLALRSREIEKDQLLQQELKQLQKRLRTSLKTSPLQTTFKIEFEDQKTYQEVLALCQKDGITLNNLETRLQEQLFLTTTVEITNKEQKIPFQIANWMEILSFMKVKLYELNTTLIA